MRLTTVQKAGIGVAAVASLGLGAALLSESVLGLVPCALCLVERWPYRAAAVLGALSLVSPRWARPMVALAAVAMLVSAGLGALHVGVEQGWWPSPLPECAAPRLGGGSMAERLSRMPARPAKPCDEPTYLVRFLPLSMAGMNAALSLALGFGLTVVLVRARRTG